MSTRIHIDRLRLSGIDERTARAAMAQLPDMLSRALIDRRLIDSSCTGMRVDLRSGSARDVARAVVEALLRDQP
ncbi:hypothetical protein EC912_103142 [Luteibacter rhizovicinus]|uniref:Uncharacterized protein n=1 Tax=Luteibacter rhizovicinus TaxID=242606 RepID=A0A4R3YPI0_9GAMM|nr:hypothetical protein [Luteibacter rhizovicinus]TCV94657.1 hypothetical protein EC912_103142 [Luteibacter rhizovicinus]